MLADREPSREFGHGVGRVLGRFGQFLEGCNPQVDLAHFEAGHFDVVINNAGSGHFGAAEMLPVADITQQFQILFFAPVRLMQLALAEMRSSGTGLIINVTSLAERLPVPFMAAYNAAKAAMAAFIMSIQLELTQSRIRIVDLQPADICTSFNDTISPAPTGDPRVAKTWEVVNRNLQNAPPPAGAGTHPGARPIPTFSYAGLAPGDVSRS